MPAGEGHLSPSERDDSCLMLLEEKQRLNA